MKQILIKQGEAIVEDVPAPQNEVGRIIVRVDHSCISIGTEVSGVTSSGTPLWKRAMKDPAKVKKAFEMVLSRGLTQTCGAIKGELESGYATGYSAAGVVLSVGDGVNDISPGDKVACAGAQCAHHAEIISVPRNLLVKVPEPLSLKYASTVTLGAIAMQGVRRAAPSLGEIFVVIGLGILGQLTVQFLKANGCRVIGTDLDPDRIALAQKLGMDKVIPPGEKDLGAYVARLTDGVGADGVIITAASSSSTIVANAFLMCRKKGRVVLVGDVGLQLNRADFYKKEIDFFISTSYGPGRYDQSYEEKGIDYPISYVRWTENRNMAEYLRLLAEGKVDIGPMIQGVYPVDDAPSVYNKIKNDSAKPLMVLVNYPGNSKGAEIDQIKYKIENPLAKPALSGKIRIAVVGAGGFAKAVHLPNLAILDKYYQIRAIVSRTGHNAKAAAKQFGANYSTTDVDEVLNDPDVDAVLIATRHNLHAGLTLKFLEAGKHVLVEKPLAISKNEVDQITSFFKGKQISPILLTGFNRRFSKYAKKAKEIIAARNNPLVINYTMNAGYVPLENWVHAEEGGGRNIGEACHIYDLFTFLTGSEVVRVEAVSISKQSGYYSGGDNFMTIISFADGSIASLTYTAQGSNDYPKEVMEIFCEGKIIKLNNYQSLSTYGAKNKVLKSSSPDKGQREEILAFAVAIRAGGDWPIPLWQQVQAMNIAFDVEKKISPSL